YDGLAALVENLKRNPEAWYEANGITPPAWMAEARELNASPGRLREEHEKAYRRAHGAYIWPHFLNIGLAGWLAAAPATLGYESALMTRSDMAAAALLAVFAALSLSWRMGWARWICGGIGLWLL